MLNILALLLVVGLIVGAVVWVLRRRAEPRRRLVRDFRRLRRAILSGLGKAQRVEATRLLEACEAHMGALLSARDQHQLLGQMASAAQELTGHSLEGAGADALSDFDRRVAAHLSEFFASLARISAVVGLQGDEALVALRRFSEDLDEQRRALVALTQMLNAQGSPSQRAIRSPRVADGVASTREDEEETTSGGEGVPATHKEELRR